MSFYNIQIKQTLLKMLVLHLFDIFCEIMIIASDVVTAKLTLN